MTVTVGPLEVPASILVAEGDGLFFGLGCMVSLSCSLFMGLSPAPPWSWFDTRRPNMTPTDWEVGRHLRPQGHDAHGLESRCKAVAGPPNLTDNTDRSSFLQRNPNAWACFELCVLQS